MSVKRPLILRNLISISSQSQVHLQWAQHTRLRAITPTMCQECRFSDLESPRTLQGHFQRPQRWEVGAVHLALPLLLKLLLESSGHRTEIKITILASSALMSNASHCREPGKVSGNKLLPRRPGTPPASSTVL